MEGGSAPSGGPRRLLAAALLLLSLPASPVWASTATTEAAPAPNAGRLRASADEAFTRGELTEAIKFLSQAIQLEPENEKNHYKRYRAHLRGKKYREALSDLSQSITLDPENAQKLAQRAKLFKMLGRCGDAAADFESARTLGGLAEDEGVNTGLAEATRCHASMGEAARLMEAGQWAAAREHLDVAVGLTEAAPDLLLRRARCQFELGDFYGAAADTGRAIKLDGSSIPALELRGWAYYKLGEFEMAQTHFREGLKFDPEHKGCKDGHKQVKKMQKAAEKGKKAVEVGSFEDGIGHYRSAIAVDPAHGLFNAPLLVEVARAYVKLKQHGPAKEAAEQALGMNEGLVDAHVALSEVLIAAEEYEEAVRVLRRAKDALPESGEINEALQKAEIALKQSKEVNYYKVLGVDRRASTSEIKKAYRTAAKMYHPDKQVDATPEEKEKAEKEFLKIAEAYEVLSNEETRARYDRGEDVSGQAEQAHHHNPFGHGGFPFGGGFGGGQQHFTFRFH